jgi:hypothetical protein
VSRCSPPQQWFAHSDEYALANGVDERQPRRREDDDRGPVVEIAQFLAFHVGGSALDPIRSFVPEAERSGRQRSATDFTGESLPRDKSLK